MGLGLYFEQGEGPRFKNPIRDAKAVAALPVPDPEDELGYVMNAVKTIRKALNGDVPLIGFSGSPWTLATYMVEGGSTKNFSIVKSLMYREPKVMHQLLDKLAQSVTSYLKCANCEWCPSGYDFRYVGGVFVARAIIKNSRYAICSKSLTVLSVKQMVVKFLSHYSLRMVVSG